MWRIFQNSVTYVACHDIIFNCSSYDYCGQMLFMFIVTLYHLLQYNEYCLICTIFFMQIYVHTQIIQLLFCCIRYVCSYISVCVCSYLGILVVLLRTVAGYVLDGSSFKALCSSSLVCSQQDTATIHIRMHSYKTLSCNSYI